eukprot:Filipodium_phascolosomae@DN2752_c1_g2_i3.p1
MYPFTYRYTYLITISFLLAVGFFSPTTINRLLLLLLLLLSVFTTMAYSVGTPRGSSATAVSDTMAYSVGTPRGSSATAVFLSGSPLQLLLELEGPSFK